MSMKTQLLSALLEQIAEWEQLTALVDPLQAERPLPDDIWSARDVLTHLWAWQQLTRARLSGAAGDHAPALPEWTREHDPDGEIEATNAWICDHFAYLSWTDACREWKNGYEELVAIASRIPEDHLLDYDRYPWLKGYCPADHLLSTYHHHLEHAEQLARGKRSS